MAEQDQGAGEAPGEHGDHNAGVWSRGAWVDEYLGTALKLPERQILDRHRARLAGSVLELGCGAGRVTGHLVEIAAHVHGIDIAPAMVERCRRVYPQASFDVADLRDLSRFADGEFGAVVAAANVLDSLGDSERRSATEQISRVLAPGGLLIAALHNLGFAHRIPGPLRLAVPRGIGPRAVRASLRELSRAPGRIRNRSRLVAQERRGAGYAILIDEAHDYRLLHYYVSPEEERRQLAAAGLRLLECVDLDGRVLGPGDSAPRSSELHYVAEREARSVFAEEREL